MAHFLGIYKLALRRRARYLRQNPHQIRVWRHHIIRKIGQSKPALYRQMHAVEIVDGENGTTLIARLRADFIQPVNRADGQRLRFTINDKPMTIDVLRMLRIAEFTQILPRPVDVRADLQQMPLN